MRVAVAATLATWALPFRIDSSGLMELSGGSDPRKRASGKAFLRVVRVATPLPMVDIIHVTRATLVPTCLLAVLTAARPEPRQDDRVWHGVDLNLMLVVAALVFTSPVLFGGLGVFNFWFFSIVVLALLLAWRELSRSPGWAARLSLSSSVALIGFSRPETIAGGIVLAALGAAFAWRRRDWSLFALTVLVVAGLSAAAPTVVAYLSDRMRNQPLLTGSDATGDAPAWMLPWMAVRRVAVHLPSNLVILLVVFNAMALLAATRVLGMIRERRMSWPQAAALALIGAEVLAVGVHREGFLRYEKYGQILAVPLRYLATRAWFVLPPGRRPRAWLVGTVSAAFVVSAADVLVSWAGWTRCSRPEGRTLSTRMRDEVLLRETAPRWARSLCAPRKPPEHNAVVVIGFDERVPGGDAGRADTFSPMPCEPERWPVLHLLRREGCWAVAGYPPADQSADDALFDPSHGALCRPVAFPEFARDPQTATHAVVTFYRPDRVAEIARAVERSASCRWEVLEATESAVMLRRVEHDEQ